MDPPCRCIFLYAQGYPSQNHVRAALDASLLPWAESWVSLGQAVGIRWHQTLPEQQFRASLERCSGLTILIRTKTQSRGLGAGQHPPASPGNIFSPCSSTSSCAGGFQKDIQAGAMAGALAKCNWSGFCFLLCLISSMLRREPEHHQECSKGQLGFGAGSGGNSAFSRGSGAAPALLSLLCAPPLNSKPNLHQLTA